MPVLDKIKDGLEHVGEGAKDLAGKGADGLKDVASKAGEGIKDAAEHVTGKDLDGDGSVGKD